MSKVHLKIKHIVNNIYVNKATILLVQVFWVEMFYFSLIIGDWWFAILAILFNYVLEKNYINSKIKTVMAVIIPILYLLYIWKPLTDGTIGNIIKEMIAK